MEARNSNHEFRSPFSSAQSSQKCSTRFNDHQTSQRRSWTAVDKNNTQPRCPKTSEAVAQAFSDHTNRRYQQIRSFSVREKSPRLQNSNAGKELNCREQERSLHLGGPACQPSSVRRLIPLQEEGRRPNQHSHSPSMPWQSPSQLSIIFIDRGRRVRLDDSVGQQLQVPLPSPPFETSDDLGEQSDPE